MKGLILYGVILITCWQIWRSRNEAVFSSKEPSIARIVEDVKSLSLLWIKNRANRSDIVWSEWVGCL
ncbi:hypothetical protein HanIR_Chr06g0282671 [Helianthus annuus]|nr:hypothetical protein HanIR_Chr06g0282671 [Helianthus annuus]